MKKLNATNNKNLKRWMKRGFKSEKEANRQESYKN